MAEVSSKSYWVKQEVAEKQVKQKVILEKQNKSLGVKQKVTEKQNKSLRVKQKVTEKQDSPRG